METILINGIEFNIKALKGLSQDDFNKMFGAKLGVKTLETWQQLNPLINETFFKDCEDALINDFKAPEFKPKKKKKKFL